MRILIIAYTNYTYDGRVRRNAELLAARGDTVDVICLEVGPPAISGVTLHRIGLPRYRGASRLRYLSSYTSFFLRAARVAMRLGKREPFDLVVACSMPDLTILSALPCRWQGAKLVLDMHDTMPELYRDKFGGVRGALGARLLMLEERVSAALADRIIAVHVPHAARLLKAGIRCHRLRVVTNLPDRSIFVPASEAAAALAAATARAPFTVVCHGTVTRRLGIDVALRAMGELRDVPAIRLRIIGQGDYLDEARQLAQRLELAERVSFEEMIPLERLPEALRGASIGLVPNLASNATHLMLPVKLLEYATLGIPIIAARLKTIEHYFPDGVRFFGAGEPRELAAAIRELYRDPGLRAGLAASVIRTCARLSAVQEQDYYEALDSLVQPEESPLWSQAKS